MASVLQGLDLDEQFDFTIGDSGDLSSVSGVTELQKDLSGAITAIIQSQTIGNVLDANEASKLDSFLRSRILFDDRVESIRSLTIARGQDADTITVDVRIDTIYGPTQVTV